MGQGPKEDQSFSRHVDWSFMWKLDLEPKSIFGSFEEINEINNKTFRSRNISLAYYLD